MSCSMKRGNFKNRQQLQRCARFGAPRICFCSGFPRPHTGQCEALPLVVGSYYVDNERFEFRGLDNEEKPF